ncbi:hypothetical protein Pint_27887 [Pistacia integerrima]|uniref:Uncharacterized protein n=1 Tax=Pistacia integerrima TaxID=434235 RepID=A0ACC0YR93_9ROSI|nr:hypothetical protein Pint_27887 [Pistacia integerrima]
MALLLGSVVNGLGLFFRTLWGLQERRFSSTFRVVSSVAVSMTMALVVCFMSVHRHGRSSRGGEMIFLYVDSGQDYVIWINNSAIPSALSLPEKYFFFVRKGIIRMVIGCQLGRFLDIIVNGISEVGIEKSAYTFC